MANEMIILTRTYDLLSWLLPKAETFPKQYRQTVVRRLTDAALDFQEALFEAQSQGGSTRQQHRWHWLNDGQYRHVSAIVAELGRLLGGWRKSK